MYTATVIVCLLLFVCHLTPILARAHRRFTRLEEPCAIGESPIEVSGLFDDVPAEESPLHCSYESMQNVAEHGTDMVLNLKQEYYPSRNIDEGDFEDVILFGLRNLPEANAVTLSDLEQAEAVAVSHELYRQIAHATRHVMQAKLDEMNLEVNGGFRQQFRNIEHHLYGLLCHLKGVLMQHNEDIQHHVVQEVLDLPMHSPSTRAKRMARDTMIMHYLETVTSNAREYFAYLRES